MLVSSDGFPGAALWPRSNRRNRWPLIGCLTLSIWYEKMWLGPCHTPGVGESARRPRLGFCHQILIQKTCHVSSTFFSLWRAYVGPLRTVLRTCSGDKRRLSILSQLISMVRTDLCLHCTSETGHWPSENLWGQFMTFMPISLHRSRSR